MADWLNHVTIAAAANGTTSHNVSPSSGTVVAGTAFTPTAGRFLLVFVEGAVTSSTPSGWTLPTSGSAINNSGLYAWYRTAAGSDSLTTTHNVSNYPAVFDFYEFPAGTTFSGAASATGVSPSGGAGPSLSLTGTNWVAGVFGQANAGASTASVTWSSGTETVDTSVAKAANDGYTLSVTALDASTLTSASFAATSTYAALSVERLVVAVKLPATGTGYTASPADSEGATDAASTVAANVRQPADPAGATDTVSSAAAVAQGPADPAGATDAAGVATAFARSPVDQAGGTDSATAALVVPLGQPAGIWQLSFFDDFDGNTLSSKWTNLNGYANNNMTALAANVSVSGGNVALQLSDSSHGAYISTNPDSAPGNGYLLPVGSYLEMRAFLPSDANGLVNWPSGFTGGQNPPQSGELDLFEVLGLTANFVYHYGTDYGAGHKQKPTGSPPGNWAGWHTFGMYRRTGFVDVYWDGFLVRSLATEDNGGPHSVLLINGYNGVSAVTGPSGALLVDWVRAWTRPAGEPTFSPQKDTFSGGPQLGAPAGWYPQGASGSVAVDSNGRLALTTGTTAYGASPGLVWSAAEPYADEEVFADFGFTLDEQYPAVAVRADYARGDNYPKSGYIVELQPKWSTVKVRRAGFGGSDVELLSAGYGFSATVRTCVRLSAADLTLGGVRVTLVLVKVWQADQAEPADWSARLVDTTPLLRGRPFLGMTTGSDAAARTVTVDNVTATPAYADGATGTDAVSAVVSTGGTQTLADSAGGSDTANVVQARQATATDPAGAADVASTTAQYAQAVADSAGGADQAAVQAAAARGTADAAGGTDTTAWSVDAARAFADGAAGSDVASAGQDGVRAVPDPAGGADTTQLDRSVTAADQASGTDQAVTVRAVAVTVTDQASGADQPSTTQAGAGAATADDPAGLSDTATATRAVPRAADDAASAADAYSVDASRAVADPAGLTDTASVSVDRAAVSADAAGASDAVSVSAGPVQNPVDQAGVTDQANASTSAVRSGADTASSTDQATTLQAQQTSSADQASAADSATASLSTGTVYTDTASGTDGVIVALTRTAIPTDTATVGDTVAVTYDGQRSLAEIIALNDTVAVVFIPETLPRLRGAATARPPGRSATARHPARSATAG